MKRSDKPAFPLHLKNNDNSSHPEANGMTKREYFAAMAMQGLSASEFGVKNNAIVIAKESVNMADELLKALEQ